MTMNNKNMYEWIHRCIDSCIRDILLNSWYHQKFTVEEDYCLLVARTMEGIWMIFTDHRLPRNNRVHGYVIPAYDKSMVMDHASPATMTRAEIVEITHKNEPTEVFVPFEYNRSRNWTAKNLKIMLNVKDPLSLEEMEISSLKKDLQDGVFRLEKQIASLIIRNNLYQNELKRMRI